MQSIQIAEKLGNPELYKNLLHSSLDTPEELAEGIIICADCAWFSDLSTLISRLRKKGEIKDLVSTPEKDVNKLKIILNWHDKVYVHSLEEISPPGSKDCEIYILRLIALKNCELLHLFLKKEMRKLVRNSLVQKNVLLRAAIFLLSHGFSSDEVILEAALLPKRKISYAELSISMANNLDHIKNNYLVYRLYVFVGAKSGVGELSKISIVNNTLDLETDKELKEKEIKLNYFPKLKQKVAICISGMARNHNYCFKNIQRYIVEPLNADIFFHTWDIDQVWPGFAGSVNMSRTLGVDNANILPKELRTIKGFEKYFPLASEILSTPKTIVFDEEKFIEIYQPKKLVVERDDEFGNNFSFDVNKLMTRKTLNQAKMFYKMYAVHTEMEQYEKESGIRYDYVIRIRPDILLKKEIPFSDLEKIRDREVGLHTFNPFGPDDQFAVLKRATADFYNGLWPQIYSHQRLSPFKNYLEADSHYLLMLWFLSQKLSPVIVDISKSLSGSTIKELPNFKDEFSIDLEQGTQKYLNAPWVEAFLKSMFSS